MAAGGRHQASFHGSVLLCSGPLLFASWPRHWAAGRGEEFEMSSAADVVDAQIDAYRARDVDAFLSHYADEASVVTFDGTAMFPDKQVMREAYGKLFADSPDLAVSIGNRMTAGDFVVDEEHLSGFHFGEMPTEMTALTVYRVTDGKISRLMLLL
jgi:hypothetical protein